MKKILIIDDEVNVALLLSKFLTRNGFEVEMAEFSKCFATKDLQEGIAAFLQKRKPDFKGG